MLRNLVEKKITNHMLKLARRGGRRALELKKVFLLIILTRSILSKKSLAREESKRKGNFIFQKFLRTLPVRIAGKSRIIKAERENRPSLEKFTKLKKFDEIRETLIKNRIL